MEDALFEESTPLLPRKLTYITAALLGATLVFMVVMDLTGGTSMPLWMVEVSAVLFAAIVVFLWIARMTVTVTSDGVSVSYIFRRMTFPRDDILDKRRGELSEIRHYSNWSLKGVKHNAYTRIGEDNGVALKLKGKRVVVLSSADPENLFETVPTETIGE